ncbi:MAG: nicotinamide riboside transporter PnuC [Bacteroidota bacterium]
MIDYLVTNWLEVSGIIASLICVWLNTRQNVWGWFWAIVSSGIYAITFYQSKLYSDMELQGVFILLSIYGWYEWRFGGKHHSELSVSKTPFKLLIFCLIFFVIFTLISGYLHSQHTEASLPYLDSSLTAISLMATWMTARKYLENWLLWIVANICYVGMYIVKGLNGTSILYFLLILLAVKGFRDWKYSIKSV